MNVRFFGGTKEQYLAIPQHSMEALYFCADTRELFWGDILLTDGMRIVPTFEELPSLTDAADGVVYYVTETRNGYTLAPNRKQWLQTIYAPATSAYTVPESEIYNTVTTVGAVRDIEARIYGNIEERFASFNIENPVKAISFAGKELESVDGVYTIDRACARRALGINVPAGQEDAEVTFATEAQVTDAIQETKELIVDSIAAIEIPEVPTEVSAFNNDAGYITLAEVPAPDLSNYYTKDEVNARSDVYVYRLPAQCGNGDVLPVTEELLEYVGRLENGEKVILLAERGDGDYAVADTKLTDGYIDITATFTYTAGVGSSLAYQTALRTATYYWTVIRGATVDSCISEPLSCAFYDSFVEQNRLRKEVDAKIADIFIPGKVSELENDAGYITIDEVPLENYSTKEDLQAVDSAIKDTFNTFENHLGFVTTDDRTVAEVINDTFATKEELVEADNAAKDEFRASLNAVVDSLNAFENLIGYPAADTEKTFAEVINETFATKTEVEEVRENLQALDNRIGFNNTNPDVTMAQLIEDTYATKEELQTAANALQDNLNAFENIIGYPATRSDKTFAEALNDTFATKAAVEGVRTEISAAIDEAVATAQAKDAEIVSYVKDEIGRVEEFISNINHFKTEVVDSVAKVTDLGVLYLIKDESAVGEDKYNEYIVVDGQPTLIGDTTTNLSDYYTKSEVVDLFNRVKATIKELRGQLEAFSGVQSVLEDRVTVLENNTVTKESFEDYKKTVDLAVTGALDAAKAYTAEKLLDVQEDIDEVHRDVDAVHKEIDALKDYIINNYVTTKELEEKHYITKLEADELIETKVQEVVKKELEEVDSIAYGEFDI